MISNEFIYILGDVGGCYETSCRRVHMCAVKKRRRTAKAATLHIWESPQQRGATVITAVRDTLYPESRLSLRLPVLILSIVTGSHEYPSRGVVYSFNVR